MSDPTTPDAPKPTPPPAAESKSQNQPETDWKAKFEAQQKVNRDLEAKNQGLNQSQTQLAQAAAAALGLNPGDTPTETSVLAASLRELRDEFTKSQRENLVLSVANDYGIKDPARIADLATVQDVDAMRRLAAGLAAPSAGSDTSAQPGPRPDLSQGAQGTPAAGSPAEKFGQFLSAQINGR